MLVFPSTNHLVHGIPLDESKTAEYSLSQTIPISSSTDFQNQLRSFLDLFDNSLRDVMLCFFINWKMFDSFVCFSDGIKAKSDNFQFLEE